MFGKIKKTSSDCIQSEVSFHLMVLDFHYGGKFYDVTVHETNDNALQKETEVVTARGKKML